MLQEYIAVEAGEPDNPRGHLNDLFFPDLYIAKAGRRYIQSEISLLPIGQTLEMLQLDLRSQPVFL